MKWNNLLKPLTLMFTIMVLFPMVLYAQETTENTSPVQNESNWPTIPTLAMFVAVPTITILYGMETWDWGEQSNWRWAHEGFFGQNTDSGGADKIGHGWAHYLAFRIFHNYYDWSENGRNTKWIYSIGTATFLGVGIEVGDAFTGKYGFSYEDVVADMLGIGLGILLEYSPTLDSLFGFSWQYWPTESYFDRWGKNPLHMSSDYSGAKYVFNFRLAGLQNLGIKIPNFMRYIQLDIGYFTRNYVRWDETTAEPYRSMYYGISLNFMEVVKDFFENPDSKASRILQQPFKYYHIPAGYFVDDKI
ncbi:MAG: DUF2279 domain-containing protein [Spirochaetota bacterium]